jgi:hypothetical protein
MRCPHCGKEMDEEQLEVDAASPAQDASHRKAGTDRARRSRHLRRRVVRRMRRQR